MMEESTEDILYNLQKEKRDIRIKKGISVTIILVIIGIVAFLGISFLSYRYWKSPEIQLSLGAEIGKVSFSENEKIAYIKLKAGTNLYNITKIKFIFTDEQGKEYVYETTDGIKEIEVPYTKTIWDIILGIFGKRPEYLGVYDYEINSTEIGLENFENINEVSVLFEYKTKTGEIIETPKLDTETPIKTPPSPRGPSEPAPCTSDKDCFYYYNLGQCGTGLSDGCNNILNCNDCNTGETCINNSCVAITENCTDSDAGINYYEKGTASYSTTINVDYCNNGILFEYYCNNAIIKEVNYNCSLEEKVCLNGRCIELKACTSDANCSYLNDVCGYGVCNTIGSCEISYNLSTDVCRESIGECDAVEYCTRSSSACPANAFQPDGTLCTGGTCDGSGSCVPSCTNDSGCSDVGNFCDGNIPYNCSLGSDGCLDRINKTACESEYYCRGGSCAYNITNALNLNDNTLILFNENTLDAIEIAEYYADKRGISYDRICGIRLPPGQFATADQLSGAKKTIIEECLCNIVSVDECGMSKINEIAEKSPITYLVIIKGIPLRLTGTGWIFDNKEPSLDYCLSSMIYRDYDIFNDTTGSYEILYQRGKAPNPVDFLIDAPVDGYIREVNPALDRVMAYGRIEAMTKNRTLELIDRSIEAERKGISGNFLISLYDENDELLPFFRDLTSSYTNECINYLPDGEWSYENCSLGVNAEGRIPGEEEGNILKPINAGLYLGNSYGGNYTGTRWNSNDAFDGFYNMLKWQKSGEDCIELCRDFLDPLEEDLCRENSEDYFKEINTDCVGAADGFLGWQLRSWTVQYYGFWPPGWSQLSGGNGEYEKTPPIILEGNAYQNEKFIDNKYLHYGSLDAVSHPECVIEDETIQNCSEIIAVNLRQIISFENPIEINGQKSIIVRFRHRNPENTNSRMSVSFYIYYDDGTYDQSWKSFYLNEPQTDWKTEEATITSYKDGRNITSIFMDVFSPLSYAPREWLDLDAFELIDEDTGEEFSDINKSSFNLPYIGYTAPGDYASNSIDRLGGIAWWGCSSHINLGYAYAKPEDFAGAFYSGKSLGETLTYMSSLSGIFYGDPLYRPSGVKIYVNNGINKVNNKEFGYVFLEKDISNLEVYINAFHGQDNFQNTRWNLSVCYEDNVSICNSEKSWQELMNGQEAVFGLKVYDSLEELVPDLNSKIDFIMKLKVWNSDDPENDLTNYAYFYYDLDVDNDDLPDTWENENFGNLSQGSEDDFDKDNFWNIEEFGGFTNPTWGYHNPGCYLERHCIEPAPYCIDYRCWGCLQDDDCEGDKPDCFYHTCVECKKNETCEINHPEKPYCEATYCRECVEDSHCGAGYCVNYECRECISHEDCNGETPFCVNNNCVECISHDNCTGEHEYCWLNNSCAFISCENDADCEDFDDCSKDECVEYSDGKFCKFTKFENEEECYYCSNFSYCNKVGGFNICGGADINRNGSVGYEDTEILIKWFSSTQCNTTNLFCNYSDIDRSMINHPIDFSDLYILKKEDNKTCNVELELMSFKPEAIWKGIIEFFKSLLMRETGKAMIGNVLNNEVSNKSKNDFLYYILGVLIIIVIVIVGIMKIKKTKKKFKKRCFYHEIY